MKYLASSSIHDSGVNQHLIVATFLGEECRIYSSSSLWYTNGSLCTRFTAVSVNMPFLCKCQSLTCDNLRLNNGSMLYSDPVLIWHINCVFKISKTFWFSLLSPMTPYIDMSIFCRLSSTVGSKAGVGIFASLWNFTSNTLIVIIVTKHKHRFVPCAILRPLGIPWRSIRTVRILSCSQTTQRSKINEIMLWTVPHDWRLF